MGKSRNQNRVQCEGLIFQQQGRQKHNEYFCFLYFQFSSPSNKCLTNESCDCGPNESEIV